MWSSCPCVRSTASIRNPESADRSGAIRSIPGNVSSGNETPTSTRMLDSAHFNQRRFLPNSPRPPRGTISTGAVIEEHPRSSSVPEGRPFAAGGPAACRVPRPLSRPTTLGTRPPASFHRATACETDEQFRHATLAHDGTIVGLDAVTDVRGGLNGAAYPPMAGGDKPRPTARWTRSENAGGATRVQWSRRRGIPEAGGRKAPPLQHGRKGEVTFGTAGSIGSRRRGASERGERGEPRPYDPKDGAIGQSCAAPFSARRRRAAAIAARCSSKVRENLCPPEASATK